MYKFITSVSDSRNFFEFLGVFRKSLQNMFGNNFKLYVNYVTKRSEDDALVQKVKSFSDELWLYEPIDAMDDGNYAKVLRMINACKVPCEPEEKVILMDSDIIMLHKDYFSQIYDYDIGDGLGTVGKNIYANTPDSHKFPMSYCFGRPEVFQKIVNPKNLDNFALLDSWSNIKGKDGKENPFNDHARFSDESLLYHLLANSQHRITTYDFQRPDVNRKYGVARRVDRVRWDFSREGFDKGYYIDFVPMRPFNTMYKTMKELIDIITENQFDRYKIEE